MDTSPKKSQTPKTNARKDEQLSKSVVSKHLIRTKKTANKEKPRNRWLHG